MEWRKSWARNWDDVKFCSDKCRGAKPTAKDAALETMILKLLDERGTGKTICPSEAARAVAKSDEREAWEQLMEPARAAARRLVAQEKIVITQGGHVVDGSTAKGPIRLRRR
jgi:nucleoid-associated protein YgaU